MMIRNAYSDREIERLRRENMALRSMCLKLNREIGRIEEDNRALRGLVVILNKKQTKKEAEVAFYLFS